MSISTWFFAETSTELDSSSILSSPLDVILHTEPVQSCIKHRLNERLMFLSSGRINWIFLPKSHLTLMSILYEVPGSIDSIILLHPQIILHEVAKSTVSKSEGKLLPMGEGVRQEG